MSKQDDGGPAFPCDAAAAKSGFIGYAPGMSLRDWFAGQALCGMLPWRQMHFSEAAVLAYCQADAMLAARCVKEAE